jgi:hypothetical protein
MGRYVTAIISTEGGAGAAARAWSNIGIVGRSTGDATVNTLYQLNSAREAKAIFGSDSALYQSCLILFDSGASTVFAVPAEVTAQTQETFSGDDSTTEFTLAGGIPAQPLDSVTVGGSPLIEGTDFEVDYGNKKVIFGTAPITGVNNIAIDFSLHTSTQFEDALEILEENLTINVVMGAMINDTPLLQKIKDHCTNMAGLSNRTACYMAKKDQSDETELTTLASALEGYKNWVLCHKSLKDGAASLCGRIAALKPWDSLVMKDLVGLEQTSFFNTTEQGIIDSVNMIFTDDPPKDGRNATVCSSSFTLDTTGNLSRVDRVRTLFYCSDTVEYGLNTPNVIGTLKMNLNGLEQLNFFIQSLLNPLVRSSAIDGYTIDNPAYTLFAKQDPTPADEIAKEALQTTPRLEGQYSLLIGIDYSGAMEYIEFEISLGGG